MIDKMFADHFATHWIDSWNQHDLVRILSHYTDDFEMSSPVIIQVAGELSGTLKGKEAVGSYWAKALQLVPNLHFELVSTLVGVNSITLYYNGVRGASAEVFHFNQTGKVTSAFAHYWLCPLRGVTFLLDPCLREDDGSIELFGFNSVHGTMRA
jgi:hypothetical protein